MGHYRSEMLSGKARHYECQTCGETRTVAVEDHYSHRQIDCIKHLMQRLETIGSKLHDLEDTIREMKGTL